MPKSLIAITVIFVTALACTPAPAAPSGISILASSKAAVNNATINLAVEFGPSGVRINAVAPGVTASEVSAGTPMDERMRETIIGMTPMGRIGEPSDIAKAVLLLASDDAGWITGQIVNASSGLWL